MIDLSNVLDVSKVLKMDKDTLRAWVRSGNCPFGTYIKNEGNERGRYYINRNRLEIYLSGADMFRCPMQQNIERK